MREGGKPAKVSRRTVLAHSGAAMVVAGMVNGGGSDAVFAAALRATNSPKDAPTLVRMARDLYPHDRLPDAHYEAAVATVDEQLAADPENRALLEIGVRALDAAAVAQTRQRYVEITGEDSRIAVLRSVENTPFFAKMRSGLISALYNQRAVWTVLGYEGSSAEFGGYLHRGFDDIDWLPA